MDSCHQKFIPSTYWKQILCSVDFYFETEFIIAACTKQGDLLEFLIDNEDNSVKDTNCIDIDSTNVKVIKVFFSMHDPFGVFYLLHTHSDELLIIEKNNNKLKIKEKIYKVQKFEISDVHLSGSPQVSVWYANSKEPNLITDFSDHLVEQSLSDKPNDKLASVLKNQLKQLGHKILERQSLLEEKNNLKSEMLLTATQSIKVDLKINQITQKQFSGKLFVILELENIDHFPIVDLQLVITADHSISSYKTYFLKNDAYQICCLKSLKHKCLGVVMFDDLAFITDKLILRGSVHYCVQSKNRSKSKSKNEIDIDSTIINSLEIKTNISTNLIEGQDTDKHCLFIPPVEFDVNHLMNGLYECIGSSVCTKLHDVYCIMLASSQKSFSISDPNSLGQVLRSQLSCSLLSVKEIQGSCSYYYTHHGFISGTLFCIDSPSSTLTVYYKTENQLKVISLLLKQVVDSKVHKDMTNTLDFQADVTYCLNLLRNEILHDTIHENPKDFFNVNKKNIFEIQKILSKYHTN